jgi:hypothetical protein
VNTALASPEAITGNWFGFDPLVPALSVTVTCTLVAVPAPALVRTAGLMVQSTRHLTARAERHHIHNWTPRPTEAAPAATQVPIAAESTRETYSAAERRAS